MKKLTTAICAAVLSAAMAVSALAAPSISALIPEATVKIEANVPEGAKVVMQNAATENYENKEVANVVTKFNDDKVPMTVAEALEALHVDTTAEIKTTGNTVVDPTEYEAVMPFVDLALDQSGKISYTIDGDVKATFIAEVAKDKKAEDLLIMQIDTVTGEVYFIEVEDYDPATGEITATFPCLGPFTILEKGAN